ncbi:MAG: hypothetical protein WKF37_02005 [Bryobacteraceae bacterium]
MLDLWERSCELHPIKIGIVELDDSLQSLVARIARNTLAGCEVYHTTALSQLENPSELDMLVYNIRAGFAQIELWRRTAPSTRLILLVDTVEADTWTRIHSLAPVSVLTIPFGYQELQAALS